MASRIRVEERRRAVARRVLEIAAIATNHNNLLALLATEYGKKLVRLGSGCSRAVHELPQGLALKTTHWLLCPHNNIEWEAYQKRPDLIVPMYGHFQNDKVNVIVVRKVLIDKSKCFKPNSSDYTTRYQKVSAMFGDSHTENVGFIRNRLYITDVGHGLFVQNS